MIGRLLCKLGFHSISYCQLDESTDSMSDTMSFTSYHFHCIREGCTYQRYIGKVETRSAVEEVENIIKRKTA